MNKKGVLLVLSGPSGCGKGTVLAHFIKNNPDVFISISATTRPPRPGETHGEQYYFISHAEFQSRIQAGGMFEYAEYCGNFYGTPKKEVLDKLDAGINVILEIEVQGAMQIKQKYPEAVLVFVSPPSMGVLRERLIGRGTESKEVIEARMETAYKEMRLAYDYDYVVINDVVENASAQLEKILCAACFQIDQMKEFIDEVLKDA